VADDDEVDDDEVGYDLLLISIEVFVKWEIAHPVIMMVFVDHV
jgi:hypothetical protein